MGFEKDGSSEALEAMKKVHANEAIPLEKFNPYHDEKGRFANSEGAHSVTISNAKAVVTMKDKDAKNLIWSGEKHNPVVKETEISDRDKKQAEFSSITSKKYLNSADVKRINELGHAATIYPKKKIVSVDGHRQFKFKD